jgi:hypothetical protein
MSAAPAAKAVSAVLLTLIMSEPDPAMMNNQP